MFKDRVFVFTRANLDGDEFKSVAGFPKPEDAYKWIKEHGEDGSTYHVAGMIRADIAVAREVVSRASVSSGTGYVVRAPRDPNKPRKPRAKRKATNGHTASA